MRQRPLITGLYCFMEVWKKVKGFENYEVSSLGIVKRCKCLITYSNGYECLYKEKILKQENVKGYRRITLAKNNTVKRFLVHRLVAEYFLPNPTGKPCVNHINGVKTDNNINNLEWVTYSENEKHSYLILNKINSGRKLKDYQVSAILTSAIKGRKGNIKLLASIYNVDVTTIYNVLNRKYYV